MYWNLFYVQLLQRKRNFIGEKTENKSVNKKENKDRIIGSELGLINSRIIVTDNREKVIRNGFRMRVQDTQEIQKPEVRK